MIEAVKTATSSVGIWAIVIVGVCCLAFWLSMVMRANRRQVRDSGLTPGLPSPPGESTLSEVQSGPPAERDLVAGFEMPAQRVATAEAPTEPIPADVPTRPDLPVQTAGPAPGMPAQRSGEGDRAERGGTADRDRR
jgi:hypothetical protein